LGGEETKRSLKETSDHIGGKKGLISLGKKGGKRSVCERWVCEVKQPCLLTGIQLRDEGRGEARHHKKGGGLPVQGMPLAIDQRRRAFCPERVCRTKTNPTQQKNTKIGGSVVKEKVP